MGVVVAPIIGPTLGGWITDNYSWRWVFFINIPVGLLSVFLTTALIHDPPHVTGAKNGERIRIDYIGVGLGFLQVVLDKGQRDDWFGSHFIVWCTIASAVGLIGAVIWELRSRLAACPLPGAPAGYLWLALSLPRDVPACSSEPHNKFLDVCLCVDRFPGSARLPVRSH
jgi:MFS family permease